MVSRGFCILAIDDPPMTRCQNWIVHIGMATALSHKVDNPVVKANRRIGQGQA